MVNLTSTALLQRLNVDKSIYFQEYIIQDGETPEIVAHKLYNRPEYHWVLIILNNIINPYTDWYIPSTAFDNYVSTKYKHGKIPLSTGTMGIHHFENKFSRRILNDKDDLLARQKYAISPFSIGDNIIPITNYEYEKTLNNQRQLIQVINPRYIENFIEHYLQTFMD